MTDTEPTDDTMDVQHASKSVTLGVPWLDSVVTVSADVEAVDAERADVIVDAVVEGAHDGLVTYAEGHHG